MTYLSQLILFTLALLSALYKTIKEDEQGKPRVNRLGMRLPTKAGAVIIILSTLSFMFAVYTKWNDTREQDKQRYAAQASQQQLLDQLGESNQKSQELRKTADDLRDKLDDAREQISRGFGTVTQQQASSLDRNLRRFSDLIRLQEKMSNETNVGIGHMLHPISPDRLGIVLDIAISGRSEWVKSWLSRIIGQGFDTELASDYRRQIVPSSKGDKDNLFPDSAKEQETALYSLIRSTPVRLYIIPPDILSKLSQTEVSMPLESARLLILEYSPATEWRKDQAEYWITGGEGVSPTDSLTLRITLKLSAPQRVESKDRLKSFKELTESVILLEITGDGNFESKDSRVTSLQFEQADGQIFSTSPYSWKKITINDNDFFVSNPTAFDVAAIFARLR